VQGLGSVWKLLRKRNLFECRETKRILISRSNPSRLDRRIFLVGPQAPAMKFDGRWIEKVFRQKFPLPNLLTRKNIRRKIRTKVSIFVPTLFSGFDFMRLREAICVAMFSVFPARECAHG